MPKVEVKIKQEIKPALGLVCWAHVSGYPWYPARVVNRDDYQKDPKLDEDEILPPPSDTNMMVEFFDKDKLISVVEREDVCEYCSNMHLVRQTGRPRNEIVEACRRANLFIRQNGTTTQRSDLDKLPPFEEYIKPRRKSSKATEIGAERTPDSNESLSIITDLQDGCKLLEDELHATNPNVDHLGTVCKLVKIGFGKLANNMKGDKGALDIVHSLRNGNELLDYGLRSTDLDVDRLSKIVKLITLGLSELGDQAGVAGEE